MSISQFEERTLEVEVHVKFGFILLLTDPRYGSGDIFMYVEFKRRRRLDLVILRYMEGQRLVDHVNDLRRVRQRRPRKSHMDTSRRTRLEEMRET